HKVDLAELVLHLRTHSLDVSQIRDIAADHVSARPQLTACRFEIVLVTSGQQHFGSAFEQRFDHRKTHTMGTAGNNGLLVRKPNHQRLPRFSLSVLSVSTHGQYSRAQHELELPFGS